MKKEISTRIDVIKYFNKYILEKKLISIDDKSIIICNDELKDIFNFDYL